MSNWTQEEIIKTYQMIQDKAAKDIKFRKLALEDPKKAFEEVAGKEVPDNVNIRFIENEPDVDQTFVLPDMIDPTLTDEDLDNISGGDSCTGTHTWTYPSECSSERCKVRGWGG